MVAAAYALICLIWGSTWLALGRVFLDETVAPAAIIGIVTTLSGVGIAIVPTVRTAPAAPHFNVINQMSDSLTRRE